MTKQNRRTSDDSWFLIAIICRETSKIDMQMNKKKEKKYVMLGQKKENFSNVNGLQRINGS